MAQPVLTAAFPALLKKTLKDTFGTSYGKEALYWPKMFDKHTTTEAYDDDQEVAGLGLMPLRTEGAVMAVDAPVQGYATRYTQQFYGLRMLISEQQQFFNQYKKALRDSELLGASARLTQEYEHANVFIRAFNTSFPGGDTLPLCSTSHKLPKGGTFSNSFSTALSLSEVAVEQMSVNLDKLVGSNGLRHGYQLKALIIPSDLQYRAARILRSDLQNDTNNNAVNVLKGQGITIAKNPFFTSATNWWGRSNCEYGTQSIWSREPTFRQTSVDNAEMTEFTASMWFALGWTDPRQIYGSNI